MMKDLSHLDKQLENRTSAKLNSNPANPQSAKQLLDSYLNQADPEHNDSSLNKTSTSHISHRSLTQNNQSLSQG